MSTRVQRAYARAGHAVPDTRPVIYYGLDLGQAQDYTALAVLRTSPLDGKNREIPVREREFKVGHLDRVQLGTSYPAIVRLVARYMRHDADAASAQYLVIDRAGPGAAAFDLFEEAGLEPWGVFSTAGDVVTKGDVPQWLNVPKRDLVGAANVAMQTGRLKFTPRLKYAKVCKEELANFVVRFTRTGHDTYEAQKSGDHDDLVIAVSLCAWAASTEYVDAGGLSFGYLAYETLPLPMQWRGG